MPWGSSKLETQPSWSRALIQTDTARCPTHDAADAGSAGAPRQPSFHYSKPASSLPKPRLPDLKNGSASAHPGELLERAGLLNAIAGLDIGGLKNVVVSPRRRAGIFRKDHVWPGSFQQAIGLWFFRGRQVRGPNRHYSLFALSPYIPCFPPNRLVRIDKKTK